MTRRTYVEVANSYAPFTQAVLQGLGCINSTVPGEKSLGMTARDRQGWPAGRSYVGIAHFRAPYDEFGYFQDGSLQGLNKSAGMKGPYVSVRGLGAVQGAEVDAVGAQAPGAVKRFLMAGDPVSSLRADVTLPFNQVHPYVYGGIALAALATSYVSYKKWKKAHGGLTG